MASSAHAEHLYQTTIKLFGSEPEPPFEDERRLMADWGRKWGVDNDVGKIRSILMHRPGPELDMVDRSVFPSTKAYLAGNLSTWKCDQAAERA